MLLPAILTFGRLYMAVFSPLAGSLTVWPWMHAVMVCAHLNCTLQAPVETDDAFMTDDSDPEEAADLEAEFEAEKNSRSLASLFGGEENVIEIDAEYKDDALKVCRQLRQLHHEHSHRLRVAHQSCVSLKAGMLSLIWGLNLEVETST